ncbi:hypothetical protein GCM10023322_79090 [Rugosimonospora acidiphila]|uniref:Uncharacterized protein n=1 Tax=Rugosimonospora acidiphila TaxID=556531 RepID=A0ABP9SQA3_9ACTN
MLSFPTVHALTECLLQAQHDTPPAPMGEPEQLGTIVLAQDRPIGPVRCHLRQLRILQLPLLGDPHHHTLPALLHRFADTLAPRPAAAGDHITSSGRTRHEDAPLHPDDLAALRLALSEPLPGLRLLAWAVCYDDVLADAEEPTTLRRVEAVDIDGRFYQLSRRATETGPVVLLDEHPNRDDLPATYPALARLATTGWPAQN